MGHFCPISGIRMQSVCTIQRISLHFQREPRVLRCLWTGLSFDRRILRQFETSCTRCCVRKIIMSDLMAIDKRFFLNVEDFTYPTPPSPHRTAVATASGLAASLDSNSDITVVRPTKSGFRPMDTNHTTFSTVLALSFCRSLRLDLYLRSLSSDVCSSCCSRIATVFDCT